MPASKAGWLVTLIAGSVIGLATALFLQITARLENFLSTPDLLLIFGLYLLVIVTNVATLIVLVKLTSGKGGRQHGR